MTVTCVEASLTSSGTNGAVKARYKTRRTFLAEQWNGQEEILGYTVAPSQPANIGRPALPARIFHDSYSNLSPGCWVVCSDSEGWACPEWVCDDAKFHELFEVMMPGAAQTWSRLRETIKAAGWTEEHRVNAENLRKALECPENINLLHYATALMLAKKGLERDIKMTREQRDEAVIERNALRAESRQMRDGGGQP
jgi:hypothetical protein